MNIIRIEQLDKIFAVDVFDKEFKALFGKNKNKLKKYEAELFKRLLVLSSEGKRAHLPGFEFISGNIFAIRLSYTSNPRVLYAFVDNNARIILLKAFKEKSKNDYQINTKIAEERLISICKEHNDGNE